MIRTREPQYGADIVAAGAVDGVAIGPMAGQAWNDDPKHLGFTLARHKFVAKMLTGRRHVLEIGCGDGFGTSVVAQHVESITAIDFDPFFVAAARRHARRPDIEFLEHDITLGPVGGSCDAAYALDVLEHIDPAREPAFLRNVIASLETPLAPVIIGMPSLESQAYAHPGSKAGHVNCKSSDDLAALLCRYFTNVFMFGMNDEVLHTGFGPMCHYLLALCCGRR